MIERRWTDSELEDIAEATNIAASEDDDSYSCILRALKQVDEGPVEDMERCGGCGDVLNDRVDDMEHLRCKDCPKEIES